MFQRDYMLRIVEQMAQAVARIAKLEQAGEEEAALAQCEACIEELSGMSARALTDLPSGFLPQLVEGAGELNLPKGLMLARLLAERGRLGEVEVAKRYYSRALLLYDELLVRASDAELEHFADHRDTMTWLALQ